MEAGGVMNGAMMTRRISKNEAQRKAQERAKRNNTSYTSEYAAIQSEYDIVHQVFASFDNGPSSSYADTSSNTVDGGQGGSY
jgi:hypothetical protein